MAVPTPNPMSRLMYLSTLTAATTATLSFTKLDVATQGLSVSALKFVLRALNPDTNSVSLTMRLSQAGAFISTSKYGYGSYGIPMAGTLAAQVNAADNAAQILLGAPTAAATGTQWGTSGEIYWPSPFDTVSFKTCNYSLFQTTGATTGIHFVGGGTYVNDALALDGIQLFFSGGNITSGSVDAYALIAQ